MRRGWAVLVVAMAAGRARGQGWSAAEHLKRHPMVVVATADEPGAPMRCRLERVDADVLSCRLPERRGVRVVFPRRNVLALYRVPSQWKGCVAALAGTGVLLGFMATGNPVALVIGLAAALIVGSVADEEAQRAAYERANGLAPEPQEEKLELVYWRPVPAAPAPASTD